MVFKMRIIYPMDCNGSASAITYKYVISHIIKNPHKISPKSIIFPCVNVQYLFYYYFSLNSKGDYPMLMTKALLYFKTPPALQLYKR